MTSLPHDHLLRDGTICSEYKLGGLRVQAAAPTARKHDAGGRTTGTPTLVSQLDSNVVDKVREWRG